MCHSLLNRRATVSQSGMGSKSEGMLSPKSMARERSASSGLCPGRSIGIPSALQHCKRAVQSRSRPLYFRVQKYLALSYSAAPRRRKNYRKFTRNDQRPPRGICPAGEEEEEDWVARNINGGRLFLRGDAIAIPETCERFLGKMLV